MFRKLLDQFNRQSVVAENTEVKVSRDMALFNYWGGFQSQSLNPLTRMPQLHFSQADEDIIIERIFNRISVHFNSTLNLGQRRNTFLEFGPGDGLENNTLSLLAKGWTGGWIGNEELEVDIADNVTLTYVKEWVSLNNILTLTEMAIPKPEWPNLDLVSLDFDGNDFHFTSKLLESGVRPKVWIAEYNAKFTPGTHWVMPYDEKHQRLEADDYWGASFRAFCELFDNFGYFPVACSSHGVNLFFVKTEFKAAFEDIPEHWDEIFVPSLPYLPKLGYPVSSRTVESFFSKNDLGIH